MKFDQLQSLTPRVADLEPRVRDLEPRVRDLEPRLRELEPRIKDLEPRLQRLLDTEMRLRFDYTHQCSRSFFLGLHITLPHLEYNKNLDVLTRGGTVFPGGIKFIS